MTINEKMLISIASNLAEGSGRSSMKDKARFTENLLWISFRITKSTNIIF
jgi:hypothetical protein